jgi:FdhD protein
MHHITESYTPLESDFVTNSGVILQRMRELQGAARLYSRVRGVHAAVLANNDCLLISAEDVGRHNAVDKIAGKALQLAIGTRDAILLTSGRISSEMLSKARRMDVPIVASRTAPTSTAIQLAQVWNICVIGYVRQGSMRVYTHPQRLAVPERVEG